jgi:hypothetical protein
MSQAGRSAAIVMALAIFALSSGVVPARADGCQARASSEGGWLGSAVVVQGQCLSHDNLKEQQNESATGETAFVSQVEPEPEPVPTWALEPVWGLHRETGEICLDLVESSSVTVNDPIGLLWEARMLVMLHDPRLDGVEYRWCRQGPGVPVADPSPQVHAFVRTIGLPDAEVWVAPGYGLTGMPAFLEVSGQERFEVDTDVTGFGRLEVSLAPVSVHVDWGDGTLEQVEDGRLGAPFDGDPAEQIVHEYLWPDDEVVVSATVAWQAAWSVGRFSGVLDGLEVAGELELPVHTRRAVRSAPDLPAQP